MTLLQNPFTVLRTDYLSDQNVIDFFAPPPHIGKLLTTQPVVLKGGRGTGKTMLLRYLSFEVQKAKFLKEHDADSESAELFWRQLPGFGIYVKLNPGDASAFQENRISEHEWVSIFAHFFNMIICEQIITLINSAVTEQLLVLGEDQVDMIVSYVEETALRAPIPAQTLTDLQMAISREKRQVELFLQERSYRDVEYEGNRTARGEPIEGLVRCIQRYIPELNGKPFFILLDEYEALLEPLQKMVNTLIRMSSPTVCYKVAMRPYGFRTRETLLGTTSLEARDYAEIEVERTLSENMEQLEKLLFEITEKRLKTIPEYVQAGRTDIRAILHDTTDEEEALRLARGPVKSHIKSFSRELESRGLQDREVTQWVDRLTGRQPLLDKFNQVLVARGWDLEEIEKGYQELLNGMPSTEYARVYEQSRSALLYLLIRDYGRQGGRKQYCGFQTFVRLSSGIIKAYLELCDRAFYYAQMEGIDIPTDGVPVDIQTDAAERNADAFYDSIADFSSDGRKFQAFVKELGALFREYHLDPTVRSPEVTFFSTYRDRLEESVNSFLEQAQHQSIILIKRSMKSKEVSTMVLDDFMLNRILAPKFGISYRLRNRVVIRPESLGLLVTGDPSVRASVIRAITKRRREISGVHQLVFDFEGGGETDDIG